MPRPRRNLSFMIKPASENCNIDCAYCFYHRRPDDPYAGESAARRMDDATVDALLEQAFAHAAGGDLAFGFQGGEPLLAGLPFFERFCRRVEELGRPGQVVSLSLQTNGLLLTPETCRLLKRYSFLVGLSLDGPERLHDAFRKDYAGRGTYARVLDKMRLLQEHRVDFNLLGVINRLTQDHAREIYLHLAEDLGQAYLQFNPCVEERDGRLTPESVTPDGYRRFQLDLFEVWRERGYGKVSVRSFDAFVNKRILGESPMCTLATRCADTCIVEYNGDAYPCDFHVGRPWLLGNLRAGRLQDLLAAPPRAALADEKEALDAECRACAHRRLCRGGCPKYRRLRKLHDGRCHDYFCEGTRDLLDRLIPATEDFVRTMRARAGRGAEEA